MPVGVSRESAGRSALRTYGDTPSPVSFLVTVNSGIRLSARSGVREADPVQQRPGGDQRQASLRERLEAIRARSEKSSSWRSSTQYLARLINREGFVPIRTRLAREDFTFLAGARDEVIAFADLGLRLLELHQPRDAGGISSDPESPIRRCRACMWRWPCPTFRAIDDAIDR